MAITASERLLTGLLQFPILPSDVFYSCCLGDLPVSDSSAGFPGHGFVCILALKLGFSELHSILATSVLTFFKPPRRTFMLVAELEATHCLLVTKLSGACHCVVWPSQGPGSCAYGLSGVKASAQLWALVTYKDRPHTVHFTNRAILRPGNNHLTTHEPFIPRTPRAPTNRCHFPIPEWGVAMGLHRTRV